MLIQEAEAFVMAQRNNHPLNDFADCLKKLGNPQDKLKTIHITGTNGKGSTSAFLRDMLMKHGFKVGTFQSPHYLIHRDRIRINNVNISQEEYLHYFNQFEDFIRQEKLGMFEITYIMAMQYFLDQKVDIAIIEAGIGGRHDSTNALTKPVLSIITGVDIDHTELLGPTIASIAYDKAGIIKDECPIIIGEMDAFCACVIKEEAEIHHSSFYTIKPYRMIKERYFIYEGEEYKLNSYALYQMHNASLALESFRILAEKLRFSVDLQALKQAVSTMNWPGRFERVEENPTVILDGAHNMQAVKALTQSLDLLKGRKLIIYAALSRKMVMPMLGELRQHCDDLLFTGFDYPGAANPFKFDCKGILKDFDYVKFYAKAKKRYDIIVFCGSLYFLSEVNAKIHFSGNKID